MKSCLNCRSFTKCNNPKKGFNYVCKQHLSLRTSNLKESIKQIKDPKIISKIENEEFSEKFDIGLVSKKDFDLEKDIEDLISSNSTIPTDIRINDKDLPLAPNFFTFCTGKQFLNAKPFAKQLEIGIALFNDYCPNPKCSRPGYIDDIPYKEKYDVILDNITLLHHGKCPKCGNTRTKMIKRRQLSDKYQLALLAGQRSGKTILGGFLNSYVIHRFLKLQDPTQAFEEEKSTTFHGIYTALTFNQAVQTIWSTLYYQLTQSPWFENYHNLISYYSQKYGEELFRVRDTFVTYRHRKMYLYAHGPHMKTMRGRALCNGGIDEIGLFSADNDKVKISADEVYSSLLNSFRTIISAHKHLRREGYDLPNPMMINISSVISRFDKIWSLTEIAKTTPHILGKRFSSWDFNPKIKRADLEEEYAHDMPRMMRDFGSVPPMSSMSFISDVNSLKSLVSNYKNSVILQSKYITTKSGTPMKSADCKIQWTSEVGKVLTIDAGISNNSFAMTLGSLGEDNIPQFDSFMEIIPEVKNPIHFTGIFNNVISKIIQENNVTIIASDRWECVTGDTLIATNKGILPINKIGNKKNKELYAGYNEPCSLITVGKYGPQVSQRWIYSGIKPTLKIRTRSGYSIQTTYEHPILVLHNNKHIWIKAQDIKKGDLLCINTQQIIRKDPLLLNLKNSKIKEDFKNFSKTNTYTTCSIYNKWRVSFRYGKYDLGVFSTKKSVNVFKNIENNIGNRKLISPNKPKYMTPDLAFIIGALISKGHYDKYQTKIYNTEDRYLLAIKKAIFKVFGIYIEKNVNNLRKFEKSIQIGSIEISNWWKQLGLYREHYGTSSYKKVIPWSILESDEKSQLAFIASYIEGDGHIDCVTQTITIHSYSNTILKQFQVLLNAHGIAMRINSHSITTLSSNDAFLLYKKIKPYFTFKHSSFIRTSNYSFPSKYIKLFLNKRRIKGKNYINDKGEEIKVTISKPSINFSYAVYEKGGYDKWLNKLRIISNKEYKKLLKVFQLKYRYDSVTSISVGGEQAVYDLSMKGDPSFNGNGLIIHNSKKMLQDVEAEFGIAAISLSLKYNHFLEFRDRAVVNSSVRIPQLEMPMKDILNWSTGDYREVFKDAPVSHFIFQCLTVRDITGKTVEKGEKCQSGDTLIPTEKGLLRLDEIGLKEKGTRQKINILVGSNRKPRKAIAWHYNGVKDTIIIETYHGNTLNGTKNHKNLVLDENTGTLLWKKSKDCKKGDLLCINKQQTVRKSYLPLNLDFQVNLNQKITVKPKFMTPDLASIIGLIISKGCFFSYSFFEVSNFDKNLLKSYIRKIKRVFGTNISIYIKRDEHTWKGLKASKNLYKVRVCSIQVSEWLQELGVKNSTSNKEIPWSILQADEQSQLAFLASYLEGDGSTDNKLIWFSYSTKILKSIQILLNSHGYAPIRRNKMVRLTIKDSNLLWKKIKKYMITKKLKITKDSTRHGNNFCEGVPARYWINKLFANKIKNRWIKCDNGEYKPVYKCWHTISNYLKYNTKFTYDDYKSGSLDEILNIIKKVIPTDYVNLKNLLDNDMYIYTSILKIKKGKRIPVFDLSMEGKNHSFIANGLVIHNTTDDIFRSAILAYTILTDPEYAEFFAGNPEPTAPRGLGSLAKGVASTIINSNIGSLARRGSNSVSKGSRIFALEK